MRALSVVLALGVAVGGLTACGAESSEGGSPDKSIKDFDFDNATVRSRGGEEMEFDDGHHTVEGYEDTDVGWHIAEGPKFTDIDGDDDLDAALVYQWIPAAGASTFDAFVWTWDGETAVQVEYPITGGNGGRVFNLTADKDGFRVTTVSRPLDAPSSEQDGEEETFTVGLKDGYPVQTEPAFGSVDRCVPHPDDPPGSSSDGTAPRVAPETDAPTIGRESDFTAIHTVPSIRNTDEWRLVRATHTDGTISCGWIKTDEPGQR